MVTSSQSSILALQKTRKEVIHIRKGRNALLRHFQDTPISICLSKCLLCFRPCSRTPKKLKESFQVDLHGSFVSEYVPRDMLRCKPTILPSTKPSEPSISIQHVQLDVTTTNVAHSSGSIPTNNTSKDTHLLNSSNTAHSFLALLSKLPCSIKKHLQM